MIVLSNEKFVEEKIIDKDGNELGIIRFNPKDNNVMKKIMNILNNIVECQKRLKNIGEIPKINNNDIKNGNFEVLSDSFNKINQALDIEADISKTIISDLSEIFGEETVNIFTKGTLDIDLLDPLIDFILPHIKEARKGKVNKYLVDKKNNEDDVME